MDLIHIRIDLKDERRLLKAVFCLYSALVTLQHF